MKMPPAVRTVGLATLGYLAVTIAYTWPLAMKPGGVPHDLGDPLMTTWLLWWSGTQAVPLTAYWWNAPTFFPAPGVLGFSEHLLGLVPIAAPITALTGSPLAGHNVAFMATFVLSALGAHFLAHTLTRRHDVSIVAALAFAFAPYRLSQAPHIQVLASYWTPVCLAALHRFDRSARGRWALVAALAWALQALSCGYYLFFLSVLVGLWFAWFAVGRWTFRRLALATAPFLAGALLLAPFLIGYQNVLQGIYGFKRSIGEIRFFSADIAGLLSASDDLLAWGWLHVFERPESALFPGIVIVLLTGFAIARSHPFRTDVPESPRMRVLRGVLMTALALLVIGAVIPLVWGSWQLKVGGVRLLSIARADKPSTLALAAALAVILTLPRVRDALSRRSPLAFYLLAAFVMWMFALGPDPTVMERRALYQAPYGWLMRLPGFDGLRVPARFWMMTLACLSVVAALGLQRLSGRARRTALVVAAAGVLMDGWPRAFAVLPAPELRPVPGGTVARLDLPIGDDTDPQSLYRQIFDKVPLYNGFSGYTAPHYHAMRTLIQSGDRRILQALALRGPLGVVVSHDGDGDGAIRRFVTETPGTRMVRNENTWSSYVVQPGGDGAATADASGTPVRITSIAASPNGSQARLALDGDLVTRWSTRSSIPQQGEVTLELESAADVAQVVMDLGEFATDFPVTLQVEVSTDGIAWDTAWSGSTALQVYYGGLRHPREVPLVLPLNRRAIRFIRLRQSGVGKFDWSIAELRVLQ